MGGRLGNHRRGLDAGGAGADHTDPFAGEVHPFMRPLPSVIPVSLKALEARNFGDIRRGQAANGSPKP
jgi:hypothetical protein